jgi:hypothetical protein
MKNIYTYILYFITKWFQTASAHLSYTWNLFTSNLKSCIVILLIIVLNKPLIVIFINFMISLSIRSIFISTIFACDEDTRLLYEQINDIVHEPGEPVSLGHLSKWLWEAVTWFTFWDPSRPSNHFVEDTLEALPACRFDNVDEAFWSLSIPHPQPVEEHLEIEIKEVTPKTVMPVIFEELKTFIKEPLDIKSRSEIFIKDVVLNAKSREEQSKMNLVESYEYWVEATKPAPLFSSNLLRELHFKLETCKNESDLFKVSIEIVKESFPIDKRPVDLSEYDSPTSNFNLYLTDLQKQMLSYAEFVSFFHFKAAALAYNKAYIHSEHDDLHHIKHYYDAEILNIRSYASKAITNILKK